METATRVLGGALAGLVLGLGTGVVVAAPGWSAAAGSNCPAIDVPSSTKSAQAVFEGTVSAAATASAKTDGSRGALYDQPVTVQTVFQGRIRTSTVEVRTDRTPRQCSLGPLDVGQTYLFFVQGDGDPWVAVSGAGTTPATADLVAQVESILGEGRPAVQPTPEQASFTGLHPTAPRTLVRTAAPGAAMVIVGLLGLAVVRPRRRSR